MQICIAEDFDAKNVIGCYFKDDWSDRISFFMYAITKRFYLYFV